MKRIIICLLMGCMYLTGCVKTLEEEVSCLEYINEDIIQVSLAYQILRSYNSERDYNDYGIEFHKLEFYDNSAFYILTTNEHRETHNVRSGWYAVDIVTGDLYSQALLPFENWELVKEGTSA